MIPVPIGDKSTKTEDFCTRITGPSTRASSSGRWPLLSTIPFNTGFSSLTSSTVTFFFAIIIELKQKNPQQSGYKVIGSIRLMKAYRVTLKHACNIFKLYLYTTIKIRKCKALDAIFYCIF